VAIIYRVTILSTILLAGMGFTIPANAAEHKSLVLRVHAAQAISLKATVFKQGLLVE
jgi:hypothetical protein